MLRFLRTLYYVLKQGMKSIFKNLFMVFASVSVVFAVLMLLGSLWSISENIQHVIVQYSDRAEVQINLHDYVNEEEAKLLQAQIESDYRVESVKYVSKEENLANMMEYFGDKELFAGYENDSYLNYISLEVNLVDFADGEGFRNEVQQLVEVDNVKDIVSVISKMEVIRFWISIGTVVAMVFMAILSVLLIFNTVKLTVFARKREIEIMKYIGASDWYICGPFVIEGVFTGLVGAIVAYFCLQGIYKLVHDAAMKSNFLGNITLLTFKQMDINFLLCFIVSGVAAGVIASLWAIRKHVNV